MNDNKPTLPNAYVTINNRNLGSTPSAASGTHAFIGVADAGTATDHAIVSIGKADVGTIIGYGPLADDLIDFFDNGGRKALAVVLPVTTVAGTVGAMTPTRVGTSDGTVTTSANTVITNGFQLKIKIVKAGVVGVATYQLSLDGGDTYLPTAVTSASYTQPGTGIKFVFASGGAAIDFDLGDTFAQTLTEPLASDAHIQAAVDTLIASDYTYDAIWVGAPITGTIAATLYAKMQTAEAKPNFRYAYVACKGSKAASSQSDWVSIYTTFTGLAQNDRLQIVGAEARCIRPNHFGSYHDRVSMGIVAGRRSALRLQNDLGRFDAGALANIYALCTGTTETMIEDLDAMKVVTFRNYKGTAGWRLTNGHMSDPNSDIKKDAWRLVLDKAARVSRAAALNYLKMDVDPSNPAGSSEHLKNSIQNALDTQIVGNGEAVAFTIDFPDGQDILVTETLLFTILATVYGHASWIGITVAMQNPAAA